MKTFKQFIIEAGDYWDPDPEKDKKLPGKGPQMRSREDRGQDTSVQTKPDYSKRLKPGETYMDFHKRKTRERNEEYDLSETSLTRVMSKSQKGGWQLCLLKEGTNLNLKTKHVLNNLKKM